MILVDEVEDGDRGSDLSYSEEKLVVELVEKVVIVIVYVGPPVKWKCKTIFAELC